MMLRKLVLPVAAATLLTACPKKDSAKEEPAPKAGPQNAGKVPGGPPERPQIPAPPDVAAPPADAQKTPSGLASKVIEPSTETAHPGAHDIVTVEYTGWTTDGKMFDSSIPRGQPGTFPLDKVIPGWGEAIQLMVKGEKRRFWIPEELAYKGRPGPQGMLVFDVKLLSYKEAPKPIPAPADVAAPPKDAKKTKSGLAYKVLTKGKGKDHPKATSQVQVHYTGWTTDGKMFDSSVVRGDPATFPLNRVIPGWTEGVQLMVEGEKTRFWIPVELAYQNKPGRPAGMLVFDVELLKILGEGPQMPMMPPSHPPIPPPGGAPKGH
jgi:peptidylprolyl isomerase